MELTWKSLQPIIKQFSLDKDDEYLKEAFLFTENLWNEQFERVDKLRMVLLSEAPLFGDEKSYIYNPETPPSSFFYFNDLEAITKSNLRQRVFESEVDRKPYMIDTLTNNGVMILDVFPFALNPKNTCIGYRSLGSKKYKELLKVCILAYLRPKFQRIAEKVCPACQFSYRYKVLSNRTADLLDPEMRGTGLIVQREELSCIGGTNMSLDREKLARLFSASK